MTDEELHVLDERAVYENESLRKKTRVDMRGLCYMCNKIDVVENGFWVCVG